MRTLVVLTGIATVLLSATVQAYIGPGAGAGTIAVVFGIIASFFLAFIAIIWFPLKRLFKRRKISENSVRTNPDDQ